MRHAMTPDRYALRKGFTLIEMLTVVVIITLLLATSASSFSKARLLAKRSKAQSEMSELLTAIQQYITQFGMDSKWSGRQLASDSLLDPLVNNDAKIVFFNLNFTGDLSTMEGGRLLNDPWGNPYVLHFGSGSGGTMGLSTGATGGTANGRVIGVRTSMSFPNHNHRLAQ